MRNLARRQYSNQSVSASFFSFVYGGKRWSIATSGGAMSIDLAWVKLASQWIVLAAAGPENAQAKLRATIIHTIAFIGAPRRLDAAAAKDGRLSNLRCEDETEIRGIRSR